MPLNFMVVAFNVVQVKQRCAFKMKQREKQTDL